MLYNIGALHSILGAEDDRSTADGLKLACTHFQCAAWAFQVITECQIHITLELFCCFSSIDIYKRKLKIKNTKKNVLTCVCGIEIKLINPKT